MLEELKKAKHYIFIEYFIVADGVMWQGILDILREKVKKAWMYALYMMMSDASVCCRIIL